MAQLIRGSRALMQGFPRAMTLIDAPKQITPRPLTKNDANSPQKTPITNKLGLTTCSPFTTTTPHSWQSSFLASISSVSQDMPAWPIQTQEETGALDMQDNAPFSLFDFSNGLTLEQLYDGIDAPFDTNASFEVLSMLEDPVFSTPMLSPMMNRSGSNNALNSYNYAIPDPAPRYTPVLDEEYIPRKQATIATTTTTSSSVTTRHAPTRRTISQMDADDYDDDEASSNEDDLSRVSGHASTRRKVADSRWSNEELTMSTTQFHRYIKVCTYTNDEIEELKRARRRKSNRKFARISRNRKMHLDLPVESDSELDLSNPTIAMLHQKEKKVARLQQEIEQLRAKLMTEEHNIEAMRID